MRYLKIYEDYYDPYETKFQIGEYVLVHHDGKWYACQVLDTDVELHDISGDWGSHAEKSVDYLLMGYDTSKKDKIVGLNMSGENNLIRKLNDEEIEVFKLLQQTSKYNL